MLKVPSSKMVPLSLVEDCIVMELGNDVISVSLPMVVMAAGVSAVLQ